MEGCAGEGPGRAGWGKGVMVLSARLASRIGCWWVVRYGTRVSGAGCANSLAGCE